jgi:hypothetical protein
MSDESQKSQLQVRPDDDSVLRLSKEQSGLIARGRRDAEALAHREPTERFFHSLKGSFPLSKVRQLAEEGDMDAQFELGKLYYQGESYSDAYLQAPCVPRDYAEAFVWFLKAADQSHLWAIFTLGDMYERGEGVPVDSAEALRYYFRAADIAIADSESEGPCVWGWDAIEDAIDRGASHGHAKAKRLKSLFEQDDRERYKEN